MVAKTLTTDAKIPVGISSCLLGQPVRFNGGHSQSRLCVNTLDNYFTYTAFCPEMAAGFGTPRPAMRLVGDPADPTLTYSDGGGEDLTDQLRQGFAKRLPEFGVLDGYILMKNSPSCGMERIKVYEANGYPKPEKSAGIFATALQQQFPHLPIEEDGRLNDPTLLENFILRVYAHHNFRHEVLAEPSYHKLIAFHSTYKYQVMAHSYNAYRTIGRLLAQSHNRPLDDVIADYAELFFSTLKVPAKRKGHANTLLHILGYLKKTVGSPFRQNIVDIVHRYRRGEVPLITPITLIKHYVQEYGSDYICSQRYLKPYPEELGLRNKL